MKEIKEILDRMSVLADGETAILATVVDLRGSGYRLPGARMLILESGETFGTVSGGCLEADVLARANKVFATGQSELFTYDTTDDENSVFSLNMGCRGVVEISLEPITRQSDVIEQMRQTYVHRVPSGGFEIPVAIALFGAGSDAIPLARIASDIGWQVTVFDHRPAYLTIERFPQARELVRLPADNPLDSVAADGRTAAVLMTHNYERDRAILPAVLRSEAFYVGALGPKRRTNQLLEELKVTGIEFTAEQLSRLYAPIGLDIGATTPESIALAIIAETQAVLADRPGIPLRERQGSIYGR